MRTAAEAAYEIRALAKLACPGRPAISSLDGEITLTAEQLELVAQYVESRIEKTDAPRSCGVVPHSRDIYYRITSRRY